MEKDVVVYGSRLLAKMLYEDSRYHPSFHIVAFCVDQEFLDPSGSYLGLPQVPYNLLSGIYPPETYDMIVLDASFNDMRNRSKLVEKAKASGYSLRNYISPSSILGSGIKMGENNLILEQCYLGSDGVMGSNNIIRQQVYLGHNFSMGNYNVVNAGSKIGGYGSIGNRCYIGMGSTIINRINFSEEVLIGAGSVVIKNPEAYSVNVGNPSRFIKEHKNEGLKVIF